MKKDEYTDISSGKDIHSGSIGTDDSAEEKFDESYEQPLEEKKEKRAAVTVFEWIQSMINATVVVVLIFTFLVRVINVDGTSMMNTLINGDKLLVTSYSQDYSYGDIVIISRGTELEKILVKRVIATEGQIVDINTHTGKVTVDNVVIDDQKFTKDGLGTFNIADVEFPVTVPKGMVFVMGDNRAVSKDSRDSEVGFIDINNIIGKAKLIILPSDETEEKLNVDRWSRFGFID
ncbi:MAG: signal peptidase I [Clostridiales bacterium]|nr:signal peptidase I [Clostridiales bacterium]